MYWKNYMISYAGKDRVCIITKLKYEWNSVSDEQLIDDLTHMRVVSNIELDPGYFDDYEKHLSWDKKFYDIPDYICKQTIEEWNKSQRLTNDEKQKADEYFLRPLSIKDLKQFEFKITYEELVRKIKLHDEIGLKVYRRAPYGIDYYKDLLEQFNYKKI